uniref:DUF2264 domain-containing protein n=1 Tax=Trichocoleus desertorum TaxID=1481672 RepID=UPI0025B33095|nr:DUF2264 domain-containing protein [Trichocoleus desertorum]
MENPFNHQQSPYTGLTRSHWEEALFTLIQGVVGYSSPGKARISLPGPASRNGQQADELEGFSRSFIMAGSWLHTSEVGTITYADQSFDIANFYRKGLLAGTDPNHLEYWGDVQSRSQHLVECATLAWSLYLSKAHIWDTYSPQEQRQIADYLFQCTKVEYYSNNWLLFNVITNTVLKRLGMPYVPEQIAKNLQICNRMYVGDGWYRDGFQAYAVDYYNFWVFHYYSLMWVILDGDSQPDLAKLHQERLRTLMSNFRYFFAADGNLPCFGRSAIYRFAYLGAIALGLHLDCVGLDVGEVKTMCNSAFKFFWGQNILTERNHLSLGYLHSCAGMIETYSCASSPYWAAKAFNLLLLPKSAPFWQATEQPLPIHRESYNLPIAGPGFLVLGDQKTGHVQLINQKSHHADAKLRRKYTNFVYSSVFSYNANLESHSYNNALIFSHDGGDTYDQRWQIENLYCEPGFAATKYKLYRADNTGWCYTYILMKDDFMINIHQIETRRILLFREGGYALGFNEGAVEVRSLPGAEAVYQGKKISFIQNLYGYTQQFPAQYPCSENQQTLNPQYLHSAVPALGFGRKRHTVLEELLPRRFYLASMVCGRVGDVAIEPLMNRVKDFRIHRDVVRISFYDNEQVVMQLGKTRFLNLALNGQRIKGKVVMARVTTNGETVLINETISVDTTKKLL